MGGTRESLLSMLFGILLDTAFISLVDAEFALGEAPKKNYEIYMGGGAHNSQNYIHSPKTPLNHLKITQNDQHILVKMVKIPKRGVGGPPFGKNSQIIP